MQNHLKVQINHTVQTNAQKVVANQHFKHSAIHKLIDMKNFCQLFQDNRPRLSKVSDKEYLQNASLFWNHLFGHIGWAVHHGQHKKAQYLTEESASMILRNFEKLVSGFDFYNLPQGFLMVKNPQTGIMDVLHYSSFLHDMQKESPPNYLAITFDSSGPERMPDIDKAHPFEGAQKNWYEFLQRKCQLNNGQSTCTEQELRSAFIRFSQTLEELGLEFYPPNFDTQFLKNPVNPIVLLARWESVLRNRHLKIADRKIQWGVILALRLENGDDAIRALSDYEHDANPCGILLPEMNCVMDDFLETIANSQDYKNCWGFRSVIDAKTIRDQKDFWRYIAFQPNRHSVQFYREALKAIDDITLISSDSKLKLIKMLAGGTTRFNAAQDAAEELKILAIWQDVCRIINRWETMNPIVRISQFMISDEMKSVMRNDLVYHLCRLEEPPNIVWLNMIFGYIKHYFSGMVIDDSSLIEISDKLNTSVSRLKKAIYKGAKFYCTANDWVTTGIEKYVVLQERLCRTAGPWHILLAAHLSTFHITNEDQYQRDIAGLQMTNQALLVFMLKILEDIQTNEGLEWQDLYAICMAISTQQVNTEIEVLNYLEQNLSQAFEANYFAKKKQQILLAFSGLDVEQIAFIDKLNFSTEQQMAVKKILSMTKSNIPLLTTDEFQNLVMKFNDFTQIFTSSDVTNFLKYLAEMGSSITNLESINGLLDLLMEKRNFTDFERVYFRNKIVKNTQNLIEKFFYYIHHVDVLTQDHHALEQASLNSMLATYMLNMNNEEDLEPLPELLQDLSLIVTANPHIQEYIFLSLEHIPGINSPEFIPNTLKFVLTLTGIQNIFTTQDGSCNIQNMQTFYSLLARYAYQPELCMTLFTTLQDEQAEPAKIKFVIYLISRLLEQNQPLDDIQLTAEFILSLDAIQYQLFLACYQNPPYAPLKIWQEWSKEPETLLHQYTEFSRTPFGPRKLEYAFNRQHYLRQKPLFNGLIRNGEPFSTAIFTDELGQRFDDVLTENRQKSIPELQRTYEGACNRKDIFMMLCAVTELLARTTSQKDLDSHRRISQEMNTTQMMAAYAALIYPNTKLQIEMDTGEGKSRVLMVIAACKMSLGATPDFITSDIQLAERDYFAYKSFFTSLSIPTSLMTLSTPEQLYQHRGINFSDNEQLQLARNKSDIDDKPFAYLNPDSARRCLILDEVDKFKKDKSKYACNYASQSIKFGEYTWVYSHLVQFMLHPDNCTQRLEKRFVYHNMTDKFLRYLASHDSDPIRVAQLSKLCHIHPEQVSTWLHSADMAIKKMKLDEDYVITEKLFPVIDGVGNTRMSQKVLVLNNGRPVEDALFTDGLHQNVLAFLNIQAGREQYVIPPEVETQRTSYPITFMGKYDDGQIIGASGTTRSGGPIADPDINYENYGYLSIPRERPLQREHKNIWAAKDQTQQIQFIKRVIQEKLAQGLPLLLICKNDKQSLALYYALSKDQDLAAQFTRVHGLTTSEEEKKAILHAGQPGNITISTAGMFSRGVDIESDKLAVRVAYVPTLEDEIQIMGRTSRAGKPGEYGMILNLSDEQARLNGKTYNIYNEVDRYQKSLAIEAEFQEHVSVIYALFLEEITQNFLLTRPAPEQTEVWLVKWQSFLNDMQKNWENNSDTLLDALKKNNKQQFIEEFQRFTNRWRTKLQQVFPAAKTNDGLILQEKASKIFESASHQVSFFKPKRHAIKVQHQYNPSDDGQARIYDTLLAKTSASLRGERPWFADYHAWREGRGSLFPNLMATLNGERPLFADLIATITRWLKEWKEWFQAYFSEKPDIEMRACAIPVH